MTIASALDHLTDVLANKDVAGYQTIEQSIIRIADMITDGEIIIGGSISPATADTLGGVKIGEGISVTSDGTISADDRYVEFELTDEGVTNATYNAILGAYNAGKLPVLVLYESDTKCVLACIAFGHSGISYYANFGVDSAYYAETADGYLMLD